MDKARLDQWITREDDSEDEYPAYHDVDGSTLFHYDPSKPVDVQAVIQTLQGQIDVWGDYVKRHKDTDPKTAQFAAGKVDAARLVLWSIRYQQRTED